MLSERSGWAWKSGLALCAALGCAAMAGPRMWSEEAGIRVVRVEALGEGEAGKLLTGRLMLRLNRGGRVKAAEDAANADATLRGTSRIWETGRFSIDPHSPSYQMIAYQGYLSVELVDKAGQTVWSYLATPRRFHSATKASNSLSGRSPRTN